MIVFSSINTLPSGHFIQAVVFFCWRNCFRKGRLAVHKPVGLLIGPILLGVVLYEPVLAQDRARIPKEVTADIYLYSKREVITGRYEKHEVKPRTHLPFVAGPIPRGELITLAPTAERIRTRKYLANSHWGLKFYEWRTCIRCHPRQARSLHAARAKITCRQCHGEEPIAGILHYYSPMHPRRRYAFVCAKCHKGSSASFATYVVHEPSPISTDTRNFFPALFYVFWFMVAIAVGTFAAFLPHTIMWGLREFLPDSPLQGLRKRLTARR
jgi:hypothetical protein